MELYGRATTDHIQQDTGFEGNGSSFLGSDIDLVGGFFRVLVFEQCTVFYY